MPYLGGLDGLRALAVVAVLLYHSLDIDGLPAALRPSGGFLGVEVFFVISGYLITALLLDEHHRSGRIGVGAFWTRRARRLLPALYALLVGVVVMAALLAHDAFDNLRAEILGAVFYVTNWLLIFQDQSYFDTTGRPSLLRHLWSLAIEEQFYLLWPLVVVGALRLLGHRAFFALTVAGAAASTVWMWVLFDRVEQFGDVTEVYYRTDTRAAGLLIGGAAAIVWRPWSGRWRHRRPSVPARVGIEMVGVAALVAVAWAQYRFSDNVADWGTIEMLFRGGFLVTSIPTIIVVCTIALPGSPLGVLLGTPVLRWIGTRSYGLYLWHWPVFQLTRPGVDVAMDGWELLAFRLAFTAALTEASYRLVEQPVRRRTFVAGLRRATGSGRHGHRSGVRWVGTAGALTVALVAWTVHSATWLGESEATDDEVVLAAEEGDEPSDDEAGTTADATDPAASASPTASVPPAPSPPSPPADDPTAPPEGAGATEATGAPTEGDDATGGAVTATVAPLPTPEPGPRITIFGDSVVLGSKKQLRRLGDEVVINARVGRQWWDAADELEKLMDRKPLGDVVVLHLGNNGPLNKEMFDEVMATIGPEARVLIVNVKVPASWESTVNEELAEGVERWPDRAVLVDWHARSDGKRKLFASDGLHLERRGQQALRELIDAAIAET